jgi:predicted Zn-dependent protease
MIRHNPQLSWLGALAAGVLLTVGCAAPKFLAKPEPDISAKRAARHEETLLHFEERRDSAQFLAAMDRWRDGDPFMCEAQLRSLVSRNPKHLEARRALADLSLERGDVATAERELRSILETFPEDAHTHHSLGLLLDMTGHTGEGRTHLARAAELSPDNSLFQLCVQETVSPGSANSTAIATSPSSAAPTSLR